MIVFSITVIFGDIVVVVKDFETGVNLEEVVIDVGGVGNDDDDDEATAEAPAEATAEAPAAAVEFVTGAGAKIGGGVAIGAFADGDPMAFGAAPKVYELKPATFEEPNFVLDKDAARILFFKFVNLLLKGETTKFSKFL